MCIFLGCLGTGSIHNGVAETSAYAGAALPCGVLSECDGTPPCAATRITRAGIKVKTDRDMHMDSVSPYQERNSHM